MKSIIPFLFLLPNLLFSQSLFLTDALSVSQEGNGSSVPRIAMLDGNRSLVYWGNTDGNSTLYVAIGENGNFGAPIELNTNEIEPQLTSSGYGPHIAAQGNIVFLTFETNESEVFCIESDDNGQSFNDPVLVFTATQGRVTDFPTVAIDTDLNPIISFISANASGEDIQYGISKSEDGGLTFLPPTNTNPTDSGAEFCGCCPAAIAIAPNDELYLGFRNKYNNLRDIWVSKSEDNGANFTASTDIDTTVWIIQNCLGIGPDIMVNGDSVFSVFYSGANGSDIYFSSLNKTSMESGYQFKLPTSDGQEHSQNYPVIAGEGDTLAVVWQEYGDNGWDIQAAWSVNGSIGLLNNITTIDDQSESQKQPDIAYQDGKFHIVYEDQATGQVMYRMASFEESLANENLYASDFEVSISPNPFTQEISVSIPNDMHEFIEATLFTALGQPIANYQTTGSSLNINENGMIAGTYLLKIQKGRVVTVKRLIKI